MPLSHACIVFHTNPYTAVKAPLLPADPKALAFFFALDGKFPGVGTLELSNNPAVRPSKLQHFSLIAQSSSAILSILMCDFLFQLNKITYLKGDVTVVRLQRRP